jgi:hypothetical protein
MGAVHNASNPSHGAAPTNQVTQMRGTGRSGTKAIITIGSGNARITTTSKQAGVGGNSLRIALVNPGGTAARSIGVSGNDITVNLAVTAGIIDGTETANSIAASLNANGPASALASFAATPGDGTSVVAAVALTNLAGGLKAQTGPGIEHAPHPSKAYG